MRTFVCRYSTPAGTITTDRRQAESADALRRDLESSGLYVLSVAPAGRLSLPRLTVRRRVGPGALLLLTQELHALVRAGLTIPHALESALQRCEHEALREALGRVRARVRAGSALSDAAALEPDAFPPLFVAALRTGERSGALPDALASHVALLKRTLAVRKRVVGALVYPAILLALSLAVVGFLVGYVVPTFARLYQDLRATLPGPTLVLVQVVAAFQAAALPLVLAGVAFAAGLAAWVRTPPGRRRLHAAWLRLPLAGAVLHRYTASRFCRTLATLLRGGIPVVQALDTAAFAAGNADVEARLVAQAPAVAAGQPLSTALAAAGAVPPAGLAMIAVGESTGALADMLVQVADFLDDDLDLRLQSLTAVVEPLLMVVMGLFVGTIVVVMYLPIFDLSGAVR